MSGLLIPYNPAGYQLLHDGALALSQIEDNGIQIDTELLERSIRSTTRKIRYKEEELNKSDVVKIWKMHYREKTKLTSNEQLGYVLFKIMGFDCPKRTEHGGFATDEETLSTIDHPFVQTFLTKRRLEKARKTYLIGIRNELVDGILRPSFTLNIATTFRSTAEKPSFQNMPVRIPWLMKLIRSIFIARPGNQLIEIDYKGVEVGMAACYHKDPTMISYLEDKTKDMHRDMAAQCYMIPVKDLTEANANGEKWAKDIRYCAKNKFVFPQFYGDWYVDCARSLWNAIDQMKLALKDGTPLKKHLRRKGIKELGACEPGESPFEGTFEAHIQKIERDFWTRRFPVYAQWRKDWHEAYRKKGWCKTKTGFIVQGWMKRNEVINYPVQGSAFHALLWSIIQLQNKELRRRKMKTVIVGQIHDSLLGDGPPEERDDFIEVCEKVTTVDLRNHWKWINVPFEIEAEVCPVGGNWAQKKGYKK